VLNFLAENHVKRIIVVAGYGSKDKKICGAATNKELVAELKEKYGIDIGYTGPFISFSGLVFGLSKRIGMEALCLFAGTELKKKTSSFQIKKHQTELWIKSARFLAFMNRA